MTKAEIINKIAEQTGVAKKEPCKEDRPQYLEERDAGYRRSRLPLIQAGQELYRENEVINILIKF